MAKTIICNGDSWVFGCELADPNIAKRFPKDTHPGAYDFIEENDSYRIPKIFSTHLQTLTDSCVINLSWPADDNTSILNRTISYITENYISKNLSTDDIFVIVGWSSPERNVFWYKDKDISRRFRLWPQVKHFDAKPQEEIWEYYVSYLWNAEEYIPRFVMNVLQLQSFCNEHNIKWLCFNSFYQTPNSNITEWQDIDVKQELEQLARKTGGYSYSSTGSGTNRQYGHFAYDTIWDTIDPIRFYKKDQSSSTFRSHIVNIGKNNPTFPVFTGWHPSPESHLEWAKELQRYIGVNNLYE